MYDKFGQFIDGKWQKSSTGETYEVLNPATEEILGKASKASIKEINYNKKIDNRMIKPILLEIPSENQDSQLQVGLTPALIFR